jgi:GNAT superfamily N-acetyltransferase
MIRACTVSDIMGDPAFPDLGEEYAAEAAVAGLPPPNARMQTYLHLEALGMLHAFGAIHGNTLGGFISLLAPVLPHYGLTIAVCESFFVAADYRHTGAGLRLLKAAEDKTKELGSPGLLVSAPYGGKLFEVLPRCGYTETSRVFFKKVAYDS